MGQIINSPVFVSVCLSPLLRSQFSLSFDETLHHGPEPKKHWNHNPTIPSPIFPHFYPSNALSMARSEHHRFESCGQIVAFDSSKDASRHILAGAWRKQVMWWWGHQFSHPFPFPSLSSLPSLHPPLLVPSPLFFHPSLRPPPTPSIPPSP